MQKDVAGQTIGFEMISSADGETPIVAGTPALYYTLDNNPQGVGAGAFTHRGQGQWVYDLPQAETNCDHGLYTCKLTGAVTQSVNTYPGVQTNIMRGTDGANTTAPDNTQGAAVIAHGDGNWDTATGFNTIPPDNTQGAAVIAHGDGAGNWDQVADTTLLAKQATMLAGFGDIKGTGWTDENLKDINDAIAALQTVVNGLPTTEPDNTQGAAVIAHGDGAGAWGAIADVSSLSTLAEMTAAFDEIKGAGWTTETLKAIFDASGGGAYPPNFDKLVISAAGEVDSLVQGYLDANISETAAGMVAKNMGFFFDNEGLASTKHQDDVGGDVSGVADWTDDEKAQIRKSIGVNGEWQTADNAGDVQQILAKLANQVILTTTQYFNTTKLRLIRGDSYDGVGWPVYSWDVGKDITGATVICTIRDGTSDAELLRVTGNATGQVASVSFTKEDTNLPVTGKTLHKFDVEIEMPNATSEWTPVLGTVQVHQDQTRT